MSCHVGNKLYWNWNWNWNVSVFTISTTSGRCVHEQYAISFLAWNFKTPQFCWNLVGVGGFSKVVATFNHVWGSFNLFMATTGNVWIIPSFRIWSYVLHIEHISCVIVNYTIPVYGVATICHQFRWLRLGHLSLFHTAMSLLIWYKMFCVRDISYQLIWMEFITCFLCMHNLGRTVVLIDKLLWFCHTTLLFWCVWRSPTPPNSSGNVQKHGHLLRFQVNGR